MDRNEVSFEKNREKLKYFAIKSCCLVVPYTPLVSVCWWLLYYNSLLSCLCTTCLYKLVDAINVAAINLSYYSFSCTFIYSFMFMVAREIRRLGDLQRSSIFTYSFKHWSIHRIIFTAKTFSLCTILNSKYLSSSSSAYLPVIVMMSPQHSMKHEGGKYEKGRSWIILCLLAVWIIFLWTFFFVWCSFIRKRKHLHGDYYVSIILISQTNFVIRA